MKHTILVLGFIFCLGREAEAQSSSPFGPGVRLNDCRAAWDSGNFAEAREVCNRTLFLSSDSVLRAGRDSKVKAER